MAYTQKQWNDFQASLPAEERISYLDYLKQTDLAAYNKFVNNLLENLKAAETNSGTPLSKIVDEGTKIAGSRTDVAAQKAATGNTAKAEAARAALARLTSGSPLTDADRAALNIKTTTPAPTPAVTTTLAPTKKTFTPAELQEIVAKLGRGEPLTAEEAAAIGSIVTPTVVTTAGPGIVTTAGPNVVTTAGPGIVTTAGPNVVTTAGPGIVTTAGPGVVTTAGPNVVTTAGTVVTTAGPDVVTTKTPIVVTTKTPLVVTTTASPTATADPNAARQSAYDLLYQTFAGYGLGSLVKPLEALIKSNVSPSEFAIKLRTDPLYNTEYKKRFAANDARIAKGLKAITEAEYLDLEDQYQGILRNAGLPESYWKRGDLGVQEGFTNFIANDVSAIELKDRVNTAQQRVLFANPEVSIALKTFYPDISNGDLLAYALDPTKGLDQIKRRITAAEIGSTAVQMGLATNVTDAEYLARYGVTKESAQTGYRTAAERLPVANKLSEIYAGQGLGAYTQQTAEQDIFNVPGGAAAAEKRRKLSQLETASFSGRAGMGALARDRAGAF
jgi:hypothetical protein